jgi:hypothetical protein
MPKFLLLLLATTSLAGDWSSQPVEPRARPTNTAYTIGKRHWQIGLVDQDFGLFDNVQVGTTVPLWLFLVPNGHAKVTAIQTRKLDVALDGGAYWSDLQRFGVPGGDLLVTPIGWTASWIVHPNLSVHGGTGWTIARADGKLTAVQMAEGIQQVTGANVRKELVGALGDGGLYAGANLTLFQTRLSADLRFNRRDSLILTSNTYVWMSGLVAAGIEANDIGKGNTGTDLQVGGSARLRLPLNKSIPTSTTLSWQFDWRRLNLRVGLPLPPTNYFAYFQAFDLYWILGPSRRKAQAPPVEDTDTDTGDVDDTEDTEDTEDTDTGLAEPEDTGTDDTGTP